MKYILILSLLIVGTACSSKKKVDSRMKTSQKPTPNLYLSTLKSLKPQNTKAIGSLTGELYESDMTRVEAITAPFGDCSTCVRGFSVTNYIGVRLEGSNLKALKANRKQSPGVQIIKCNMELLLKSEYQCEFAIDTKKYFLKLIVK